MIFDYGNDRYGEISALTEEEKQEMAKANSEMLYGLYDSEYIQANNITQDNIISKLTPLNENVIDVTNMYVSEKTKDINVYIVEGTVRDKKTMEKQNFKVIVKKDTSTNSFTIIPSDYVSKKYNNVAEGGDIDIEIPENIEQNDYNAYEYEIVDDEQYITNIINQFREEITYNTELLYTRLDKEYSEKKFDNFEEFQAFIKGNYKKYFIMSIQNYQKKKYDDYTQYVLIDKEGNNYIVRETAPMKYDLILDTYTIELPEFVERFNESTPQEQVILNLNKFMLALNDKDYKYAYSVLADSFKQSNFQTQEGFEEYVKNNFFEENTFEYDKFGSEAGTYYTYDVNIKDSTNNSLNEVAKKFIILMGEGTEYQLSFNV